MSPHKLDPDLPTWFDLRSSLREVLSAWARHLDENKGSLGMADMAVVSRAQRRLAMAEPSRPDGLSVECGHCNGYGSSLAEYAPTCTVCNGSGLVAS